MIKKHKLIAFAIAAAFLFISCNNNYLQKSEQGVPVTGISLKPNESTISLVNGTNHQINANVTPENATNKKLTYTSNDERIASVNADGLITAKAVGSVKITIKASNGVSKEVTVTVTTVRIPVTSIVLSPDENTVSLVKGTSRQLKAQVKPENATEKKLTFSSSDNSIASVNAEGLITAHKIGEAVITIQAADSVSKAVKVSVTAPVAVTNIVFDPALPGNPLLLSVGGNCSIHAKVQPENATDKNLTYTSDNEGVAAVDAGGLITAKAVGSAKITIKASNGVSKEITVTVTTMRIPVTGIELSSGETAISVENGATRQIGAYVVPENATNKNLTYSSDDETVASVDAGGLITAKAVGSANITITAADGVSKTIKVTVTPAPVPVTRIVIEGTTPASLFIGESYRIIAKAQPDEATNKELTYTTNNSSAYVAYDGTVTAQSEGTVTITIRSQSDPEITATVTITIKQRPSIELIAEEMTSESGESNLNLEIKTLHGKLSYTPTIVGEESSWLTVFHIDNTTDVEKDTIHLKAAQNKTVWKRTAYINFKDESNQVIKNAEGKKLEVKVIQKENEHPNVTIKWVHGIDEPTQVEKERGKIETPIPGQTKKFYWDDDKIFYWYESNNTKWFNNRKLYPLKLTDGVYNDSAQCWAKTASNMLHWWFEQNETNITQYIVKKNITGPEKDEYQHFYKRNSPDNEEPEKSYIAKTFRTKAHNSANGDLIEHGLVWYLCGRDNISRQKDYKGPALFKDVFEGTIKDPEKSPIKTTIIQQDINLFNTTLWDALSHKKAIGVVIGGTKDNKDYKHAITLWGAVFDDMNRVVAIYVVDNNFGENRIFPYGIWHKDGRPYLFNYGGANDFVQNRYVSEVVTLDPGEAQWEEWKSNHP